MDESWYVYLCDQESNSYRNSKFSSNSKLCLYLSVTDLSHFISHWGQVQGIKIKYCIMTQEIGTVGGTISSETVTLNWWCAVSSSEVQWGINQVRDTSTSILEHGHMDSRSELLRSLETLVLATFTFHCLLALSSHLKNTKKCIGNRNWVMYEKPKIISLCFFITANNEART
jgi:hypothetical protein